MVVSDSKNMNWKNYRVLFVGNHRHHQHHHHHHHHRHHHHQSSSSSSSSSPTAPSSSSSSSPTCMDSKTLFEPTDQCPVHRLCFRFLELLLPERGGRDWGATWHRLGRGAKKPCQIWWTTGDSNRKRQNKFGVPKISQNGWVTQDFPRFTSNLQYHEMPFKKKAGVWLAIPSTPHSARPGRLAAANPCCATSAPGCARSAALRRKQLKWSKWCPIPVCRKKIG